MYNYILSKTNEISFNTRLLVVTYYVHIHILCNIVISSLVHHVIPDDGLIEKKGRNISSIF